MNKPQFNGGNLPTPPTPPTSNDPVNFITRADNFLSWMYNFGGWLGGFIPFLNSSNDFVEEKLTEIDTIKTQVMTTANFKGVWNSITTYGYESVFFNGNYYNSLIDNNIGYQPDQNPDKWALIDMAKLHGNPSIRFKVAPAVLNNEAVRKEQLDAMVPMGVIVMWSGALTTIPAGWALCDGSNGTPDLRDRFVVGAGSTYNRGDTGGYKNAVLVSHTHTINHNHPSANTTSAGNHRHYHHGEDAKFAKAGANGGGCYAWYLDNCSLGGSTEVGNGYTNYGGNHTHSFDVPNFSGRSGAAGTSGTGKNLPPYYALAFIMKL